MPPVYLKVAIYLTWINFFLIIPLNAPFNKTFQKIYMYAHWKHRTPVQIAL